MIAFFIWCTVSLLFAGIGIYALNSKKPVRFWNISQKIQVHDVRRYNRAISLLWFVFAGVFLLLGLPLLSGQNTPAVLITILGSVFACILLMAVYNRIEGKYRNYDDH